MVRIERMAPPEGLTMRMRLLILLVYLVLLQSVGCGTNMEERDWCRASITAFMDAHNMQSDEGGDIVQLSATQEDEMKDLIRNGLRYASNVSDDFLDTVHPQMRQTYTNNLIRGWTLYLEGLETDTPSKQIQGIKLVLVWESFFLTHKELLIERLFEPVAS